MRRRKHEEVATEERASESPVANAAMNELQSFLDEEEIQRLPEKLSGPVHSLLPRRRASRTEAAQALGCKEGTLSARMARARATLQRRLTARGVTLSAALSAVAISQGAASAMVPSTLAHATFDAAIAFATGNAAGSVSSQVLGIAEGVMKSMFLTKLKLGVALLLATCLALGAAGGLVAQSGAGDIATEKKLAQIPAAAPKVEKSAAAGVPVEGETVIIGTVVDESKMPVTGATVTALDTRPNPAAKSGVDGSFRLPLRGREREWADEVLIVAEGPNGNLGSLSVNREKPRPLQVVLKTPQEVNVNVTDASGGPVVGAQVYVLGNSWPVTKGRTDAQGRWTGRVPADACNSAFGTGVIALKSKVGVDYVMPKRPTNSNDKSERLPDQIHLKLDGARTLRVKTVDTDGNPIAGVGVGLWYIRKLGRDDDIPVGGISELFQTTGIDGTLFDWLPERFVGRLPIVANSSDLHASNTTTRISAEEPAAELSIPLLSMGRISGRVTHADGRPAAGIVVDAEGQSEGHNGFRGSARTDADGRYAFNKAYCEQGYVVKVSDKKWAAPIRSGFALRNGKPVEGVDFVLCLATWVHGRVKTATAGTPAAEEWVSVTTITGKYPVELLKKDDGRNHQMSTDWQAETDSEGRYEIYLGPGLYYLYGPTPPNSVRIDIPAENAPTEIKHDLTKMPQPKTAPFEGRVVDDKGRPVAGVDVRGQYLSNSEWGLIDGQVTGDDGRFKFKRSLDPMVLCARSADALLAGIARVGADEPAVDIVLGSVGKARGRLLDLKGNPIAKNKVQYGIRFNVPKSRSFMNLFGSEAVTDDQGRFELVGLISGEAHEANFWNGGPIFVTMKTFEAKGAQSIDLGDLRVDPEPPKPDDPPAAAERTIAAFAAPKSATPFERKEKLLTEARREHSRPLLLFGQPKDPACVELFRLFEESDAADDAAKEKRSAPTPRDSRWEFELTGFDRDQPDVRKLALALGVNIANYQSPVLAVLDADGNLAASHALVLNEKQKLDEEALASFLAKNKLPRRDAEKMLAEAFTKAKAEDKRVFFIASASWCGPCRSLGRFLEPWKGELNRHYVFVKLDVSRDEHAQAVTKRLRGDQDGGVPWYAILDGDGKTLITSNSADLKRGGKARNIGFPSEQPTIDHFMKMLAETASRLSAERRAEIRQALLEKK